MLETKKISEFLENLVTYCAGNPRYLEYVLVGLSDGEPATRTVTLSKVKEVNDQQSLNSEQQAVILQRVCILIL